MRLRLEDSGSKSSNVRTLYNPKTGEAVIIKVKPQPQELSGLFTWFLPKSVQERIKIRQDARTQRVRNRQEAKTDRQDTRQKRKQTRIEKTVQRQKLKKKRLKNKTEDLNKMRNYQEAQATYSPEYKEDSDFYPEETFENVHGADYMIDPEDQGGYDAINVDYEETEEYEEEEVPEEYEELEYSGDSGGELSAGWIDGVVKVVKGAAGGVINAVAPDSKVGKALLNVKETKAGEAVTKAVNSKTGKAVQKVATAQTEIATLTKQNSLLKAQVSNLKAQRYYYGAGGALAGIIGTTLVKSKR